MMCAFNWPVSEPEPTACPTTTRRSVIVRAGEQSRDSSLSVSVSKNVEMVAIGQRALLQRTWSSADTFTTDAADAAPSPSPFEPHSQTQPQVYDEYRFDDCCPCENENVSNEEMRIIQSVCRLASYGHHSNAMDVNSSSPTHLRYCRQPPLSSMSSSTLTSTSTSTSISTSTSTSSSSSNHGDAEQYARTAIMPATSNTGSGNGVSTVHKVRDTQRRLVSSRWSPIHHRPSRSMVEHATAGSMQQSSSALATPIPTPTTAVTSVELPMTNLRERLTSIERSTEVGIDDVEVEDIDECADVHHADSDGDLSIHIAVAKENEIHVSQLIHLMSSSHWPLDVYNNMKQTPLHVAIVTGHLNIIRRLLVAGCSLLLPDRHGNNALHLAVSRSSLACVNVLLECPSSVTALQQRNHKGYTPLHLAVFRHDTDLVGLLVARGAECNVTDGTSGRTPLYHAIVNGHEDVVRKLVSLGANVNMASYAGVTPLVVATDRRLKNIASLLISRGAAVNSRDDHT